MKIIHLVLGKANPNRMNGVNKVVYNLAVSQVKLGYDVSVWGITPTPQNTDIESPFGLKLFKASKSRVIIDRELKSSLSELSGDVVFHIHGGFIIEFYVISRILVKQNISFVYTPHGSYNIVAMRKNGWIKKIYFALFERYLIKKTSRVHLIGESEQEALTSLFPKAESVIIPNGQTFQQTDNKYKRLNSTLPIFGFMGRITSHTKGLDLLLEGFAIYRKELKGSGNLWLLGDGKDTVELKQKCADLGIENHVVFHGSKFGDEKNELLQEMTAFYHTSRNEGMPGAVLEAASLGIPCVVSKATNVMDYIVENKAGWGLSENTPENIAISMNCVRKKMKSNNLATYGKNAIRMIKNEFDWLNISKKHINTYRLAQ